MKKRIAAVLAMLAALGSCTNFQPAAGTTAQTTAAVSESGETASAEPLEKYVITCDELAGRVLNGDSTEFPRHMKVTDEVMISDVMGYDTSLATDSVIYAQLVSADLFEFALLRVPGENGEAVLKMLNERKDYLKEQAAFYPAQVEAANATIVSHTDDIYFLICHKDAAKIEKALITEIKYG